MTTDRQTYISEHWDGPYYIRARPIRYENERKKEEKASRLSVSQPPTGIIKKSGFQVYVEIWTLVICIMYKYSFISDF